MPRKDIVPSKQESFADLAQQVITVISAHLAEFGLGENTPTGKWYHETALKSYTRYLGAYINWREIRNRTLVLTELLRTARDEFEPLFRLLVKILRSCPQVTNAHLVDMGLPTRHEGTRKPAAVAIDAPWYRASSPHPRRVEIEYGNLENGKRGKPAGQHCVTCYWMITDTPRVVHLKDLTRSNRDTRPPLVLELEDEERGWTLYYAMCWENTRGDQGPCGLIESVIVS
jgi:hypothetical protein